MIIPQMTPSELSRFKRIVTLSIGKQIRLLRREQGLTGRDFGALLYLSQQQISRYECGRNYITIDMLLLMLSRLKMTPELFFKHLALCLKDEGVVILPPHAFYDTEIASIQSTYRISID